MTMTVGTTSANAEREHASGVFPRPTACAHCGTALSPGAVVDENGEAFCCAGCRAVRSFILACGLDQYYRHRDDLAPAPRPATPTTRGYAELDHPDVFERFVQTESDGTAQVTFVLEGVHCGACVWLIERLPRVVPGVCEARLAFERAEVRVRFRPDRTRLSAIARALDGLGYPPHLPSRISGEAHEAKADRDLVLRLGVAFAAAGNVMLMALALYSGATDTSEAPYATLLRFGSMALTLPTVAYSGAVFFRGAWAALRTRTPHMDLPVSIGIAAGTLWGTVNTLRGQGEIYFDTITTLIFLLLVGRWLGRRHQRAAARVVDLYAALAPATARVVAPFGLVEVPARAVETNAIVEVRANEPFPVDGVVVSGTSSVDASSLTGESLPVTVTIGDRVYAGTKNTEATLHVRTEASGTATRVGRLLASVETAQRARAPIVKLADRVAGWFVWVALGLAAVTFVGWSLVDPTLAIDHAVALLVVTCPCALGMATPLAVSVALSRAARTGLLFKGGEFLEELSRPALFVLDKTGTLTEGQLRLVDWVGPQWVKPLVRAVEARSEHPIARALMKALADEPPLEASSVVSIPGGGVRGIVDGHSIVVGSRDLLLRELGVERLEPHVEAAVTRFSQAGKTPIVIAVDGGAIAAASLADSLRPEARETLLRLERLGVRFALLSGDHPEVVAQTAAALGVPFVHVEGGASPERKLACITELEQRHG
ncbi:MAG: heavy metal translocating P-type ATPase, partial [Pseudomonadota bacterium]